MGSHYAALERRLAAHADVEGALAVLDWDTAVVMPPGGVGARGRQLGTLKRLAHELLTAEPTLELVDTAAAEADLEPWQRANLREIDRRVRHARTLDPDLVEALARVTTACEMRWREAKAQHDLKGLLPSLQEVLDLTREAARQKAAGLGIAPYDALLDANQPGLTDATVARLLEPLADSLPGLLDEALLVPRAGVAPAGPFPVERQQALARELMATLGFDFTAGRLDESAHPFCGGVPDDIRLTTRYRTDEVVSGIMGVLHETGHALYEAGLPASWRGQPVGEQRGILVHESQSLLLEMQVCRSPAFLAHLAERLTAHLGPDPGFTAANLVAVYHQVRRGFIRVDADEVTYPMHVLLRWRLERAMIAGDLALADLPGAWNDGMHELIGVVPPHDGLGCLQDIHWPLGGFGYFPNYTLGAMLAAQLMEAVRAAMPALDDDLRRGDVAPLMGWLRANVHAHGSLLPLDELVVAATGRPLDHAPLVAHLRRRYLAIDA